VREDDVAARLRSVLAATTDAVRDQAAAAGPGRAQPPGPGLSTRYATGLGGLAASTEPLSWSDIVPAWPDDVDLDPLPDPFPATIDEDGISIPPDAAAGGAHVVASGVVELPAPADGTADTGGYRPGTPWASPPAPPPSPPDPPPEPLTSHLGDLMDETEPFRAPQPRVARPAGSADHRSLPPPAWVLPPDEQSGRDTADAGPPWPCAPADNLGWNAEPDRDRGWSSSGEPDDPQGLSAAGAFGGGSAAAGRGFGWGAFDPGRRGVRALAAVAVLVIIIAAVLAWRARPRVDTVTPPSFGTSEPVSAPVHAARPSSATAEVVVAVGGKVRKPGLVHLPSGSRVADALSAAGGAAPGIDVSMLNLARKLVDGELIMVGVTPPPGSTATGPVGAGGAAPPGGPVNLNTATLADLDGLPGVGPVLAQRILDARTAQGGFTAVSDLRKVDGIGDARYEQLKDLVTI
jgi:competence protein ComEA